MIFGGIVDERGSNLDWLVGRFVQQSPAVRHTMIVSSDGLPLAGSDGVNRGSGRHSFRIACRMIGLAYGSAGHSATSTVSNVIVEMENGFDVHRPGIHDGSLMCAVTTKEADSVRSATR